MNFEYNHQNFLNVTENKTFREEIEKNEKIVK